MCNIANNGVSQISIIVPEQFHFDTERRIYRLFGAKDFGKINVTSFTKVAAEIIAKYCPRKTYADEVIKGCVLHRVTSSLAHTFKYYTTGAEQAADVIAELKRAGVNHADLLPFETEECTGNFYDKMYDVSQIYRAYTEELGEYWNDRLDDIAKATQFAPKFFQNQTIIIDEFDRFSGVQTRFVRAIADIVPTYICLYKTEYANKFFASLSDSPQNNEYYREQAGREVEYYEFSDVYTEIKFAGAKAFELGEYGETAVISREGRLLPRLESAFSLYDIPIFGDVAEPIAGKPLVEFILSVLDALDFTKENLAKYIKSGFVRVSQSVLRQKNGAKPVLTKPVHPQTQPYVKLGREVTKRLPIWIQDALCFKLESRVPKLNADEHKNVWRDIDTKLRDFAAKTVAATGDVITEELCDFLINTMELQRTVFALCNKRADGFVHGFTIDKQLNDEYRMLWDKIIDIFESMHDGLRGYPISVADYRSLLYKFCRATTVAKPPQYFDTVTFGDPDRMRVVSKKYVFLLETQAGIFPKSGKSGTFTHTEVEKLRAAGIEVDGGKTTEYEFERYLVSKILALASKKTFVCSSVRSINESEQMRSPIYANHPISPTPSQYYYIKTLAAAKSYYAGNPTDATVRTALAANGAAKFVTQVDKRITAKRDYSYALAANTATKLFSEQSYTPTQIESMSECRFRYFLKYGLGFRKRDTSYISKGNIVHACLDYVVRKFINDFDLYIGTSNFEPLAEAALCEATGDIEPRAERVHVQAALKRGTIRLFEHIRQEFAQSEFRPFSVEADVAYPFAGVIIRGKSDRIDIIETQTAPDKFPEQSVRIVDYKTGAKNFSQNEIKYGLNLQALLYLFGVVGDDGGKSPAGAYYFSAKSDSVKEEAYSPENDYKADISDKTYYKTLFSEHKKRGIAFEGGGLCDSERVEKTLQSLSGSRAAFTRHDVLPAGEYAGLRSQVEATVANNIAKLQQGDIAAVPVGLKSVRCDSCEFRIICGNRGNFPVIIEKDD
ncbi:ATP-dependent helicase/deoxyribonuclease subunit B [Clostridia bacterium]|nr:ATP-dependent helicase/deoxyribonuclease subunit B [Clostridia bacterium]GHU57565.1 ATP-dependent helicase/deoxyribonuclease subunit B [Clostridia bacterium]